MIKGGWRTFEIPDPISVNASTRNVSPAERYAVWQKFGRKMRGRTWTPEYQAWRDEAILEVRRQLRPMPHCPGAFYLDITVSSGVDIDNTVKCIPDLCKAVGLIADDSPKYMVDLHVRYVENGPCRVAIRPVGEWA